jgi:glycosyltransferase involved in cell wall biosynthesis
MRSLRILILSPFPPRLDARHGGARSIAHRIDRLTRKHEVSLLYLHGADELPMEATLSDACVKVVAVDRSTSEGAASMARGSRELPRILWHAWRGKPVWAQAFASSAVVETVSQLTDRVQPEIIQVEYQVMGQFLTGDRRAPRLLIVHEPAARIAENFAATRSGVPRLLNVADRHAWLRFERRVADAADQVVVFSLDDASTVRTDSPVAVVPLTMPIPEQPFDAIGADPPSVLFVGNYGHPPNVDAALWLANEIFPRVRKSHPSARLWLVGEHPPARLSALGVDGIEVTGGVPEVASWLERAAVVVAPIRMGGGMRVKVVEALAAGKAVVSTARGVAGLGLAEGDVRIADTAVAFADSVNELLGAPTQRQELGARARRWAEDALDVERESSAYESLYEHVVASSS